jgi:hypothetical protein
MLFPVVRTAEARETKLTWESWRSVWIFYVAYPVTAVGNAWAFLTMRSVRYISLLPQHISSLHKEMKTNGITSIFVGLAHQNIIFKVYILQEISCQDILLCCSTSSSSSPIYEQMKEFKWDTGVLYTKRFTIIYKDFINCFCFWSVFCLAVSK